MTTSLPPIDLAALRRETIGDDFRFRTPFGTRRMLYADYTASGRNVGFIERYLMTLRESYANTHTEDDVTGRSTTELLHRAEEIIKGAVNGNRDTCFIAVGTGATGAIKRLQEILGVYVPPATRDLLNAQARRFAAETGCAEADRCLEYVERQGPVVFIGPFEHHSNEISWRESLAEVVTVGLAADGGLDLEDLERKLAHPRYAGRRKIGSFSAASNVTGMRAPVYHIARILHRHDALACFDFAASAPYVRIDMNRDEETYLDAVFFSPHKFLGGPGSPGILLFNRRLYRTDLPPCFSAGGTVDYVGPTSHDYISHIEEREKPGTPGTLQILRAALAMQLAQAVGEPVIEERELRFTSEGLSRFAAHPHIEILGHPDPERRIGIVSFNIRHDERYLHPKLVTRLLNDLFGIQSRAGCSCAGPYGHYLLAIGDETSERYRNQINVGCTGIKPGWVRVGFHYTMDELDVDYICRSVEFLADNGPLFLPLYRFDLATGAWNHREQDPAATPAFGLAQALATPATPPAGPAEDRAAAYQRYLAEAETLAKKQRAQQPASYRPLPPEMEELSFFNVVHYA